MEKLNPTAYNSMNTWKGCQKLYVPLKVKGAQVDQKNDETVTGKIANTQSRNYDGSIDSQMTDRN